MSKQDKMSKGMALGGTDPILEAKKVLNSISLSKNKSIMLKGIREMEKGLW